MVKVYPFPTKEWNTTYEEIREWRNHNIDEVNDSYEKLNEFHDEVIRSVVSYAIKKNESEWGPPPTHFAFFMMGSAARSEQSVWSDQDHGIVFGEAENPDIRTYFIQLGEEIAQGLDIAGYDLCDGRVMANNPRWCKSLSDWKRQIHEWLDEDSFESHRFLLTFFDSRVFYGRQEFIEELKEVIFERVNEYPYFLKRFFDNIGHLKRVKGIFGQLLPETRGPHTGCIHFKQAVLFPYVNVLRILAIKENIKNPSTLERFQELPTTYHFVKEYKNDFSQLLSLGLKYQRFAKNYGHVHYLNVKKLTVNEKRELKKHIEHGNELFKYSRKFIEKGCK